MIEIKGTMSFAGGVHPQENKRFTEQRPIELFTVGKQVAILLGQHIGAICKPVVAKKEAVTAGQVIGRAEAFVSAPVHSSVNGVVKDITLQSHPVLGRAMAVIIETDAAADNVKRPCPQRFGADFDASAWDPVRIREAIQEAGVVGMGGAGFPTRVKLEPNPQMPKDVIIINGCECEPFITCDYRVMTEWTHQVLAGVQLAARAAECSNVKIAIEDNKPEAIKIMHKAVRECREAKNIEVVPVRTKYPQGGERQLIKAVWKKDVPVGGIPPMIGVVVLNVATCAAIAEAVVCGNPLTHRVATVSGSSIARPGNYYVPIGTPVADLIDYCGGLDEKIAKVILGGPMMGFAIADLSTPITKTGGAVTLLTKEEITRAKYDRRETPCIRCGRCLQVCPAGINPTRIAHAVKHGMLDVADQYHMNACIECGCCSYICPANIELTGYIKTGKILVARAKKRMPQ
ncbi:MAG: electron transport complex subunit RsxC [Phycisphaerae bacterium]|nr:electron transport complex subunit RsxC [Phycisphaerae bacterium]